MFRVPRIAPRSIPRARLRGLIVLVAAVAGVLCATGSAAAHAVLVSTAPDSGAHLDKPPAELELQLNEPVTIVDGSAQVINSAGTRFAVAVRLDEGHRRIVLAPAAPLPDGAYLATARVVSADTHVVSLSIQFTVGSVTEPGRFAGTDRAGPEQYLIYPSKGAVYLGLVLSAGLYAAARWVWPATTRQRRFRITHRIGTAVLIIGLLGRFTILVAQQSGGLADLSARAARTVLGTPYGVSILVAVAASIAALAIPIRAHRTATVIGVLQAATAIVAVTLSGHGGSAPGWPWSFLGTLAHVYAISVWLGGVAVMVVVSRGAPELRRWHAVAIGHVVAAVTAGLALSLLQVWPLAAWLHTTYGLVLLGKVVGVLGVVALGGASYRWFRTHPDSGGRPRVLVLEAVLAVAVLGVTTVLTSLAPARDTYTTNVATTLRFGGTSALRVDIDSIRHGPQQITLDYGTPVPPGGTAPEVGVDLSSASANVARLPVRFARAVDENGQLVWRSDRLVVPAPGRWKVTVRFEDADGARLASFFYQVL